MSDLPDLQAVAAAIRETAASEVMPRFQRLAAHEIRSKASPDDLVTTADVESERHLSAALTRIVPGSVVVGEEAAEADPKVLRLLGGEAPAWIIDPVDGTHNFAHGRPKFAVIVAFCRAGRTLAGWIHDPVNDVTGIAAAGQGAWINGARVQVAAPVPVAGMRGSLIGRVAKNLKARHEMGLAPFPAEIVRHFSTGLEYLDLARGRLHFAHYTRLKPWDHAAGVLLHREAGGFSALRDRTPYRPTGILEGSLLMAPDPVSWDALHAALGDAA